MLKKTKAVAIIALLLLVAGYFTYSMAFSHPVSKTGPVGPSGQKGDKGDKGVTGASGPIGPKGDKGERGDTGAAGSQGATGTTGAAGAAGTPGSPGLPNLATLHGDVTTGSPVNLDTTIPVDQVTMNYGTFQENETSPLITYPAGQIVKFNEFSVYNVDTTAAKYNISANIDVCNQAKTQCVLVNGWVSANNATPGDAVTNLPANLSVYSHTGTDLTYDSSTGRINSAAGGNFWVVVTYVGTQG